MYALPFKMGQQIATLTGSLPKECDAEIRLLTEEEVKKCFRGRCSQLYHSQDINRITSKVVAKDKRIITLQDFLDIFGLPGYQEDSDNPINSRYYYVRSRLYNSFSVMSKLPFLSDKENTLTVEKFMVGITFAKGDYQEVVGDDYSYIKLLFIALSDQNFDQSNEDEKSASNYGEKEPVRQESFQIRLRNSNDDNLSFIKRIVWSEMDLVRTLDGVDITSLTIDAHFLHQLITFYLIVLSLGKENLVKDNDLFVKLLKSWELHETYGFALLRYLNVNVNADNLKGFKIYFQEFSTSMANGLSKLFLRVWKDVLYPKAFPCESSRGSRKISSSGMSGEMSGREEYERPFKESKLINDASILCLNVALEFPGIVHSINKNSLTRLFSGSVDGYSIRSMEVKTFSWKAPTILIVSGKRLKRKAVNNKVYQVFGSMYPRTSTSIGDNDYHWQSANDRIVYAIYINEPWRHSNKKNFGDKKTTIVNLFPRFDVYPSAQRSTNNNLIYINTNGFGIGIGNDQPIQLHNSRRYSPGNVSITIEANLEYGVFRHISSHPTNAPNYFTSSRQPQIKESDFEDRFTISDIEIWGVGSDKELEYQKKEIEWQEKEAERRREFRFKDLDEERAFLEMAGFIGSHRAYGGSV